MAKTKKGDLLSCSVCGLVLTVDEICGCEETMVVCCDEPMAKGKVAANKARKMISKEKAALPKPAKKGAAKPKRKAAPKKKAKAAKK